MKNTAFPSQSTSKNFQEREITIHDYIRILVKHKTIVLTFLAITFFTVVLATFTATPFYTASSQILIEQNFNSNDLERPKSYIRYDPDFLATQFQLISSSNVAHRVVKNLQLDTRYRSYFIDTTKQESISFFSSLKNRIKKFTKKLFPSHSKQTTSSQSDSEETNLLLTTDSITDADIIATTIRSNLSISLVKNSRTVSVEYSDKNPAMAKLVLDAMIQAYRAEILEIKLATSNYSLQWMTSKADDERKKLELSERALQKYVKKNDLVTVENKLAVYPERLKEFNSQLSKAQAKQKEYESIYTQIQNSGETKINIESIPIFADNRILQSLREKIFRAEQKIKDLSKKYGYKHPLMINAKTERDLLKKEKEFEINRIIDSTKNAYDLAKKSESNLKQLLEKTKSDMLDINERFTQYSIMKREVSTNRVLYDALTSSINKASVTEQSQDMRIWVIKKAERPNSPSKPQKTRNLILGLILGILGGIGLAFFVEYLDNSVKDEKDIENRFGLTVLGSIPKLQDKSSNVETYFLKNLLSPLAESYRLIRAGLLLSAADHPPHSILITSMVPKEGKTATTINLARVLAQTDQKVLIIDCDMRRPQMHSIFNTPNSFGLSNYLSGNTETIQIQTVQDKQIFLITSGASPPNPAELLQSTKMKSLIEEMLQKFDFVLLDSPPVQSVTDSLALSNLVDGTLLVVRAEKTTYDSLESGLKKIGEAQANILGVVLNGTNKSHHNSGYYGYYQNYNNK